MYLYRSCHLGGGGMQAESTNTLHCPGAVEVLRAVHGDLRNTGNRGKGVRLVHTSADLV